MGYQIGQFVTGEGAWFVLTVSICARCGFGTAWFMITNFTHSHWWNEILASDSYRSFGGVVTLVMSILLGGRHRWKEMHDAAEEVLAQGLFKKTGDAETKMDKHHKK